MAVRYRRRIVLLGVGAYVLLLGASCVIRSKRPHDREPGPFDRIASVHAVDRGRLESGRVRIAYREYAPPSHQAEATILLLHGSPGRKDDFRRFAPLLGERLRVIVPDLPGFGSSTRALRDYSLRAHAIYVRQLLDALGIPRVHVLGYSMGGGAAVTLTDIAPERVTSLTLLSAIGVQEMELTGDYYVNHAVHGLQLAALWTLREAIPHMGAFDHMMLDGPYARNFFDSDQRPLREMLRRVNGPTSIIHGVDDDMVPIEAALEHHRLIPQSELHVTQSGHFLLFAETADVADLVTDFVVRAEHGDTPTRADAPAERVRAASVSNDPARLPLARGIAAWVFGGLLAGGSIVFQPVAAAAGGALVARGRVGFALAAAACLIGTSIATLLRFFRGCGRGHSHVARRLVANGVWTISVVAMSAVLATVLFTVASPTSYARTALTVASIACAIQYAPAAAASAGRGLLGRSWRRAQDDRRRV
jgi:pimeloyl-ACP methyl ester carboxylesterase